MAAKDPRLESIRAALKGVPLEDLRKAGAHLPPELARILDSVAGALDGGTVDEDALVRALDQLPQPDQLERSLGSVSAAVKTQAGQMRSRLAMMVSKLKDLEAHRDAVREGFSQLDELTGDDPELASLLERAAATVADDAPWQASKALLTRTDGLVRRLEGIGELRQADDLLAVDLAADTAELERAARTLQAATEPLLQVLPGLLDEATELSLSRDHAAAPAVALQAARVWEVRAGMGHEDATARWDRAFVAALKHEVLPAAWVAGKRLQASALPDQDYKRVAVIAHQVADLAYKQGARPQAVMARMEEAQCLARLPEHRAAARTYADDAIAIAEKGGDPALLAQGRLMYGQVLELLEDNAAARAAYRKALDEGKAAGELSTGHGRIALHLGRLQAQAGLTHQAQKNLSLAMDLGLANGDPSLLSAVLKPAVDLALAQGDEAEAGTILRAVVQAFAQGGQEGQILAHAAAEWGDDRVALLLRG